MRFQAASLRELARIRHGFFGRQGGVSEGPWTSLNVGLRNGDRPEAIAANRARASAELGISADRLVTVRQVHGVNAIGAALIRGVALFEENQFEGARKIIDLSGDSAWNPRRPTLTEARSAADRRRSRKRVASYPVSSKSVPIR